MLSVITRALTFYFFFFQAEDGIRDLVRSRGLGDVYKRQVDGGCQSMLAVDAHSHELPAQQTATLSKAHHWECKSCLLYTSDAADERSSVDLGGRRIIKKKKNKEEGVSRMTIK